ncbi:protein disulfide-isomerase TMX3 [Papilio machaon]|uniref:protein disulfide-isomerase TMX3 n=1 Tax=Papilio machaon TaxID=76193 RepID=UPI001E6660AF|nr:protein disulfide-isomerase TMX3 [Papilio machaon]
MKLLSGHLFFFIIAFSSVSSSRVLELSDKFIDLSGDGMWFVKFYAPWCAHCRRLEPIWAHVAQSLYNTAIKVAKVDCTRFPTVATHYKVRAYPTIMFIKGSLQHEYTGEREKDDMVKYAMRMAQPAVQRVTHADSIGYLKESHNIFFGYVGKTEGILWEMFALHAEKYQPHTWFYVMSKDVIKNEIDGPHNETAVFVYKEDGVYLFDASEDLLRDQEALNTTLDKWINTERFGFFPKITRANINHFMDINKYIVIAIVSENKLGEITQTERDFKDMIESIIRKKKSELHENFQFGWMGTPELANSIAMSDLTVPHLLVLNSTTSHHHIPDDDPVLMTPEAVVWFLEQIYNQQAPTYGGDYWLIRLYRAFYEARTTLGSMWRGNPVLTALVFGLPLGFLSLICYSVFCSDILDSDEDEEIESHEKKD